MTLLLLYSIFRPLGVAADLLFASQVELSWVLKRPHKRKPAAGGSMSISEH